MKRQALLIISTVFLFTLAWLYPRSGRAGDTSCTPGEWSFTRDTYLRILSPADGATVPHGTVPVTIEYGGCAGEHCECHNNVCEWVPFEYYINPVWVDALHNSKWHGVERVLDGTYTFDLYTSGWPEGSSWTVNVVGLLGIVCPGKLFDIITVNVKNDVDLDVIKTDSPDPVAVNEPLTYTIMVTNNGPANATGVVLTDVLPAEVTFSSVDQGVCSHTEGVVTCNIGNLNWAESFIANIVVIPSKGGTITNTASVDANEHDSNISNNLTSEDTQVLPLRLFTIISGTNDHGEEMIARAKKMFRYDDESFVSICERYRGQVCTLVNPYDEQVRQKIIDATNKAKEKGKDVIVNIDMDLENFILEFPLPPILNRWHPSVRWGGRTANIVSKVFEEENPSGVRMLYAHSAGGDATYQSISQSQSRMYDDINILNGRTNARNLSRALSLRNYEWWRVKVFTSDGDYPAAPGIPIPVLRRIMRLFLGSISNYDAAKFEASEGAWVHLHSPYIVLDGEEVPPKHSGLRDCSIVLIEEKGCSGGWFEVNLGGLGSKEDFYTVEETMKNDWKLELE